MFEAYKIGVKLSLVDGVTAGLLALAGHFRAVSREVDTLQGKIGKLKAIGALGVGSMAIGSGMLMSLKSSLIAASEYQERIARMTQAGYTAADIKASERAAWSMSKAVPTASPVDVLDNIMHLRMVFGHTAEAIQALPTMLRMEGIMREAGVKGEQSYDIAKSLEMIGKTHDPAVFASYADAILKGIIQAGGKVSAADYLSAFKYGRNAAQGWNKDFIEYYLPTLIQEMKSRGGSGGASGGPGNPLASAYAAIVQGTIAQKALGVWDRLGLLDLRKVVWTKSHMMRGLQPGAIEGWQQFMGSPFEWAQKVLLPALVNHGYKTHAQQLQAISYLFPNRTASFAMSQLVEQGWKFERDRRLIENTKGMSNYTQLLAMSPKMQEEALHKRFEALRTVIGLGLVPVLLNILPPLIKGLQSIVNFGRSHPGEMAAMVKMFAALGALLLVGGAITSLTAAFGILRVAFPAFSIAATALVGPLGAITRMLPLAATGFGALLGKLGLIGAAGAAGYYGAKALGADKLGNWLGGHLYDLIHPYDPNKLAGMPKVQHLIHPYDPNKLAATPGGQLVAAARQSVTVHSPIHIDGKKVADVVTKHQANAVQLPPVGPSNSISSFTLPQPSQAY